jgi:bacterioferritin
MIIVRENLVELLNMDLELETTVALQYINHAAMLTGVAYGNITNVLRVYAHEKIEHAMALADQIKYLGGIPSVRVGIIHISGDNKEMLMSDFDEEEDAIQRYKIRIEQAEQLKEMELSKWLRTILRVEQQHAMYLQNQLCVRANEGEGLNLTTIDACDFSQVWAEKAVNVPMRIKKYE